jgi:hypothetical protein
MTRSIRLAAVLRVTFILGAAAFLLMGAAAPGLLGARIYPRVLTWENNERTITVESLSTIPVTAQVLIEDGAGWDLGITEPFLLQPNELREVAVLTAGKDNATYVLMLSAADETSGTDKTALRLEGTLRHATPWDDLSGLVPIGLGAAGFLAALGALAVAVRWGKKHVRVV